jgi:hypothetical protein
MWESMMGTGVSGSASACTAVDIAAPAMAAVERNSRREIVLMRASSL